MINVCSLFYYKIHYSNKLQINIYGKNFKLSLNLSFITKFTNFIKVATSRNLNNLTL